MAYLNCKNVGHTGVRGAKPDSIKAVTTDQWHAMLECIEADSTNKKWRRDYAIVLLGASIGMRRGEVRLLERDHFRSLEKYDIIHVPTLKQSVKIPYSCKHCLKKFRLKLDKAGKQYTCSSCGKVGNVQELKANQHADGVVEIDVDMVESWVVGFIFDYIDNHMRPDQRFLFEGRRGKTMSLGHVNRIFNTYAAAAGLDPKISFHSLRHSRGVRMYSMSKDLVLCKDALRHKNVATTQIYAKLDQEAKENYRKMLEKTSVNPLKKSKRI